LRVTPTAYVINLPDAVERWRWIESQLKKIPVAIRRFEGVRGAALSASQLRVSYDDAATVRRYGRSFTPAEIGCCLSHIETYGRIIAENESWALVFEDDASVSSALAPLLPAIGDWLNAGEPRIVLLTRLRRFATRGAVPLGESYRLVRVWNAWYAHGYAINRGAADRLHRRLRPVACLIDNWRRIAADFGIDIRGIDPYCVGQSAFSAESSIGQQREGLREGVAHRGRVRKILYRLFVEKLVATPLLGLKKHEKTW
jgi:GR25 family glycosyltransferase involved in LPS biosynthesis